MCDKARPNELNTDSCRLSALPTPPSSVELPDSALHLSQQFAASLSARSSLRPRAAGAASPFGLRHASSETDVAGSGLERRLSTGALRSAAACSSFSCPCSLSRIKFPRASADSMFL